MDGQDLLKSAVRLSMSTNTGLDFYLKLPVAEFMDITREVIEYGKQTNRIRNSNADRRKSQ